MSSVACDMEVMSSETSRRVQEKEETVPEASWTAVAKRKEKEEWAGTRRGNSDAGSHSFVEQDVSVNPEGESHHERIQTKSTRREREAPGEEGEETKSPKRKVIRVESEETQDYVRESLDLSREEAEEISFVTSAISIQQKPMF